MKRAARWLLALGLVLTVVTPAWAQQGKGQRKGQGQGMAGMMGGGGLPTLLMNSGVQKELKLTDDQVSKAQDFRRDQMESMRDRMQGIRDMSPAERQEAMAKIEADNKNTVAAFLKPEQVKRLEQIQFQNSGLVAFQNETVVSSLKLTAEQKSTVQKLAADQMAEMRELGGGQGGGFNPEAMQKRTEIQKKAFDKAVATLTDEQKSAWKELVGEPFEVKYEAPRGQRNN